MNEPIQDLHLIFGIIGYVVGVLGTLYGIKKKRELSKLQQKTERIKQGAYREKKKTEKMKQTESWSRILKNITDMFKGK